MKIVFMGTPDFAVPTLDSLCRKGFDVELVVTQKDRPRGRGKKTQYPAVKEKAISLGLKIHQPDNVNDDETIGIIKDIDPDFIVVVAFGQLLKRDLLELPSYGCINVHASLLPKYRGPAPINWAIINGEKETGVTIMEMAEGLDSGDIYMSRTMEIRDEDDYISIYNELSLQGADMLVSTLKKIIENDAIKTSQDDSLSTYAPMIYKDTGRISWNKKGQEIVNQIRGLQPWPGTYTKYKDEILKIHQVELLSKSFQGENGEIVKVSNDGVYVNAVDATVLIKLLQFPNKRKMEVKEYLAGNDIELGIVLE